MGFFNTFSLSLSQVKRILQPYKNSCVHVRVCENGLGLEGLISRITEFVLKTKVGGKGKQRETFGFLIFNYYSYFDIYSGFFNNSPENKGLSLLCSNNSEIRD